MFWIEYGTSEWEYEMLQAMKKAEKDFGNMTENLVARTTKKLL